MANWTATVDEETWEASAPLDLSGIEALPEGTEIAVLWSGGNGPHRYVIHHCSYLRHYAAGVRGEEAMKHYNELTFIGPAAPFTVVKRAGNTRDVESD